MQNEFSIREHLYIIHPGLEYPANKTSLRLNPNFATMSSTGEDTILEFQDPSFTVLNNSVLQDPILDPQET